MLQFLELCRLCAQKKRNKLDLFGQDDVEAKALIGKISFCLSVQITREDMLPKMVCNDCQKAIEQYSTFRLKCQKAEERLTKMLTFNLPNKVLVTKIKQECLEPDFSENPEVELNSLNQYESSSLINLKTVNNVKLEVYESDDEIVNRSQNSTDCPNLVQIISEELANHNNIVDVKQPIIEIISENFIEDYKTRSLQREEIPFCNIKVLANDHIDEEDTSVENPYDEFINVGVQNQLIDPTALIEVKIQEPESEIEQQHSLCTDTEPKMVVISPRNKKDELEEKILKKTKRKYIVESDVEVDKKYLHLGENEECNIDLEEWDAIIKREKDPNAKFSCSKCGKSFKFFKCWKKHKTSHESELDTFICDMCCNNNAKFFKFSNLKCLKNHIRRKHLQNGNESFSCQLCQKSLTSQGQLNAHIKKVHDDSGASCQMCGKSFKNKTRLTDHLKVHKEEKPYVCDQCGKSFKWNNGLKIHMQSHTQEKNFLCSECGKKFSAKKNLLEHVNIHTGKRPHVCNFCNASFIQLSAYSKHLYIHNEELKLHKCDKCEKSFSHNYLLKKHKLKHSGLRPYSCSTCFNSFKTQSDLCTHLKTHQEKRYPCSVCGRKFSRSEHLKDHMMRHTGTKHACPAPGCGKSFTQRFPLTKHFFKSHPSLKLINRPGGKKSHLADKNKHQESHSDLKLIKYDYKYKEN